MNYTEDEYRRFDICVLVELAKDDDSSKDADLLFPVLRRIDLKHLQRCYGVTTLEQAYQLHMKSPTTPLLTEVLFDDMPVCLAFMSLPEYILWDHKNEKLSLIKGQAWLVTHWLFFAIDQLHDYTYHVPGLTYESLNILLDHFLTTGEVSVTAVSATFNFDVENDAIYIGRFPNYEVPPHRNVHYCGEGKTIEPSEPISREMAESLASSCGNHPESTASESGAGIEVVPETDVHKHTCSHIILWDFFILTLLSDGEDDVFLLCGHLVPTHWKTLQIWFNHGADMSFSFKLAESTEEDIWSVEYCTQPLTARFECTKTGRAAPKITEAAILIVERTIQVVRQDGTLMMTASGIKARQENEPTLLAIWEKITESPSRSISLKEFLLLQLPEDSEVPSFLNSNVGADDGAGDTPASQIDQAVKEDSEKASETGDDDKASRTSDRSQAPSAKVSTGTELSGASTSRGSQSLFVAWTYLLAILVALVTGYYIASHSHSQRV